MIDWELLFLGVSCALSIYGVISARSRASNDALENLRKMVEETKLNMARMEGKHGERIQALETEIKNGIGHKDLDAIYKRSNEDQGLVHRRVDEMHNLVAQIRSDVGEMTGTLRAGLPPIGKL